MRLLYALLTSLFFTTAGLAQGAGNSVWVVDFVKTKPNQLTNALTYYQQNWAKARTFALKAGYIASYNLLVAPGDTTAGFNLMLLTEYPDSLTQVLIDKAKRISTRFSKRIFPMDSRRSTD